MGMNAASKKKATPSNKFKMSYAVMIIEAIQELKQKKGSSRQAIMKQIAGKENIVPNALMITKTLKKLIEEGRIVPGAQAGHSGAGSFKLSPQEKLSIGKAEKAAAKKVVKKTTSTKKVVKKVMVRRVLRILPGSLPKVPRRSRVDQLRRE